MICFPCLHRVSALRTIPLTRAFTTTPSLFHAIGAPSPAPPTATSTGAAQPFSTPLTPAPKSNSLGTHLKPKPKIAIPVSSTPAGTVLKGLNYVKGRDDPVALAEEEYPEWLWSCLEVKKKEGAEDEDLGDMFAKSKKVRRKAAKRQRKLELQRLASGDISLYEPKIPLTQQSIDLPANEEGSVQGALEAEKRREELREAMRRERRAKIKETNYLKSM